MGMWKKSTARRAARKIHGGFSSPTDHRHQRSEPPQRLDVRGPLDPPNPPRPGWPDWSDWDCVLKQGHTEKEQNKTKHTTVAVLMRYLCKTLAADHRKSAEIT